MVVANALDSYISGLLNIKAIKDYAPNGLQVAGRDQIKRLVSGVSANAELISQAIALDADAILVHHGFFWRGEDPCILGVKKNRLQLLLQHDINCFGYHLPLDVHPEYGNNIQLAQRLNITLERWLEVENGLPLVGIGQLAETTSAAVLAQRISQLLSREPLLIAAEDQHPIKCVAWCTGAAQDFLPQAAAAGADAFITGEVSERTTALARELGVHFYAAGHHATERYGVQALGDHLAKKFGLWHQYLEVDNPV